MDAYEKVVGTSTVEGIYEKPRPIGGNSYYGLDRLGSTMTHEKISFIRESCRQTVGEVRTIMDTIVLNMERVINRER